MAANDRILVDTAEMEATISRYEKAHSTLEDSFSKLESAKKLLDTCYEGPAKAALEIKWQLNYASVRSAENAIEAAVNGLKATIAQMDVREQQIKGEAGKLEAGSAAPTYF